MRRSSTHGRPQNAPAVFQAETTPYRIDLLTEAAYVLNIPPDRTPI